MKKYFPLIASLLAILLAIPTLKEGSSVILGKEQEGMIVLPWLVYYNVGMATFSLFVAFSIWKNLTFKLKLSSIVLGGHLVVLCILISIHFLTNEVAFKSIAAMTVRSLFWTIIFFLVRNSTENKS